MQTLYLEKTYLQMFEIGRPICLKLNVVADIGTIYV